MFKKDKTPQRPGAGFVLLFHVRAITVMALREDEGGSSVVIGGRGRRPLRNHVEHAGHRRAVEGTKLCAVKSIDPL